MREHRIMSWCDVHAHNEGEAEATHTVVVSVSDGPTIVGKYRRIDVCGECLGQLAGLLEVVEEYGVTPDEAPKPAAPRARAAAPKTSPSGEPDAGVCVVCQSPFRWLAAHYGTTHRFTLAMCVDDEGRWACPKCGETFATGQALTHHVKDAHHSRVPYLVAEASQTKPRTRKRTA